MRPLLVLGFSFLLTALAPRVSGSDTLCPTPFQQRNTCQAGHCSQTVYTTSCSIAQNEVHTCADFGLTVTCCGGELPTLSLYPCGIQSTSLPTLDLLARQFGGRRVFVLTCSRGYWRLGGNWHAAQ